MRLTSFTDYSLRVLMYLAVRPGKRATIGEIATAFQISDNHLMKVVHFLSKAEVLTSVRGKGGGLTLGRPPESINVGDVVRLTEFQDMPAECFNRELNRCVVTPVCQLKGVLADAVRAFYGVLDRYTLADVASNPEPLANILFSPSAPQHKERASTRLRS